MKVVVAGGTGFLGQALVQRLLERGDEVAVLSRHPSTVRPGRGIGWENAGEAAAADAVVNLAGENIGRRWTAERRRRILRSRVDATNALADALCAAPNPRRAFVSASAVGFYGLCGDEVLDESASSGSGFLAEVTRQWEAAAHRADDASRLVILRFGVVLAPDGGALGRMILPFRFGAGGRIGSGDQWMSWIDRLDAVRAIEWAIDDARVRGTYNTTSPAPLRNRDFARALGHAMHRPALLPVPGFALRLLFGDMANEMLLGGQRVVPARATAEGFEFRYPTVESSLAASFAK